MAEGQSPTALAASAAYGAGDWRLAAPSDTADLEPGCRGLYIAGAGTVAVMGIFNNTAVSLGTFTVGMIIPGRFKRLMATGTSATVIELRN